MTSPCGGCPPHCKGCVFSSTPRDVKATDAKAIVVPARKYGCIRPDGGDVVRINGALGMMRGRNFHPLTPQGLEFLKNSGNSLAQHHRA